MVSYVRSESRLGLPWPRILEGVGVAATLLLAGLLRMGWPGVNSFSFDEARVSLMALQMARRGQFPLVGMQSSTGLPNFPAAVWIFALPYAFSADPLIANLFVGLLGTLAVAGVWWLARKAWGTWAGLCAAVLFAASPYAVLYSRAVWGQDLLPPLAVLWAVAGVIAVSGRKAWALALHVWLAGLAFQVHYAGVVLIPATIWLIIRYRLWSRWPALLVGGAIAVLSAAPFIITAWRSAPGVLHTLEGLAQQPAKTDLAAFRQLAEMGAGRDWEWLLLGRDWSWPQSLQNVMNGASFLLAIWIGLGLAIFLWRCWRGLAPDQVGGQEGWQCVLTALLPAWALAAPLLFTRHNTPAYHQYQLAALPALFLAAGAVAGLGRRRSWGLAVTIASIAVAISQVVPLAKGLGTVAQELTPGGLGTPLMWPSATARSLMDGQPIVVHAYGDAPEFFGDVAGFDVLLWDYPHRIVDGRSVLLVPELDASHPSAHLMATFADLPAWEELQACGLVGEVRAFPRRKGEPPYMALTVSEDKVSGFQQIEPLTLDNGARLLGWRVREVGGHLRVSTWWQIGNPASQADYHQFNHLYRDQSTVPLAICDVPLSSQAWQQGDTLITWADFERPTEAGPFWIEVGMYVWPEVRRVPVASTGRDPPAAIRLGPFTVPPGGG